MNQIHHVADRANVDQRTQAKEMGRAGAGPLYGQGNHGGAEDRDQALSENAERE